MQAKLSKWTYENMDPELTVVCSKCERFSPIGTRHCVCGNDLSLVRFPSFVPPPRATSVPPAHAHIYYGSTSSRVPRISDAFAPDSIAKSVAQSMDESYGASTSTPNSYARNAKDVVASKHARGYARSGTASRRVQLSQEQLMEQAKNYVCTFCSSPVPIGHKFCGRCGTGVPEEILEARTLFFSDMQNPAKAKLVLIRGEGAEGLSYHLRADNHYAGRIGNLQFPDDPFISDRHANFFYRDNKLVVSDEDSLNGVYIRIRGAVQLQMGDTFLAGEQVFRVEPNEIVDDPPDTDGTYFYSSPKHPGPFRIVQLFEGGCSGMVVCARTQSLQIGREGGDLNFPGDPYMSGTHCSIESDAGTIILTDLNSRNGTYVRVVGEQELKHGDYVFLGRKLLRVEMNSN